MFTFLPQRITPRALLITALALSMCTFAFAARFPNAVEKTFILVGPDAVVAAKFFGIDHKNDSKAQLPLGPSDSWAVYLLKKDTAKELNNSDDGMPQRTNLIKFSASPTPSLSIGNFWLDEGTALPYPHPGVYSFGSTWFPSNGEERNGDVLSDERKAWQPLIAEMKKEKKVHSPNSFKRAERVFDFQNGTQLTVQLWTNDTNESAIRISVKNPH